MKMMQDLQQGKLPSFEDPNKRRHRLHAETQSKRMSVKDQLQRGLLENQRSYD